MEDKTDRSIDLEVVEAAFWRLSRSHQQLLLWHRVDGLSYDEMATRLGISKEKLIRKLGRMVHAWCNAFGAAQRDHREERPS